MKILVVDDDIMLLKSLHHSLSGIGHNVHTAQDGLKGLDIYNRETDFDLIISDIMMPDISGFTLLNTVRDVKNKFVPVILISALDKANEISSALDMNAEDIFTKPIDIEKLIAKIQLMEEGKNYK